MYSKKFLTIICLLMFAVTIGAEVPNVMNYQGFLTDDTGSPVDDGPYLVKFIIYDAPSAGTEIWNSGFQTITTSNGLFSYQLGSNEALPIGIFSDTNRYLGLTVGTDSEIVPRSRLITSAYAFKAQNADLALDADSLNGLAPSYYRNWNNLINIPADIADGDDYNSNPAWSSLTGVPAGFADGTDDIGSGDITGVTAGTGLSGGGTSGSVTLDLASTITSTHTFNGGTIYFGDSTMRINNNGISIGDNFSPTNTYLMRANRDYNITSLRYGLYTDLKNTAEGTIYGVYTLASNGGASNSYGIYGVAQKTPISVTTGSSYGVYGGAYDGANAYGVFGYASSSLTNWAGYFSGAVNVTGTLSKGGGAFRIDHPLDPENKYLQHSFVESPEMMNIYNGNIVTDSEGYATVVMPDYFDALNRDFRYQLTVIGDFAQAIIGEKINNRKFVIRTDKPNIEVSWQVTGIRQDVWANANRIQVELDKPESEIGTYIHSKAYGMPIERDANYENMKDEIEKRNSEDLRQ